MSFIDIPVIESKSSKIEEEKALEQEISELSLGTLIKAQKEEQVVMKMISYKHQEFFSKILVIM